MTQRYFYNIPQDLAHHPEITLSDCIVYGRLKCLPLGLKMKYEAFADELGLSLSSFKRSISKLKELGFIKKFDGILFAVEGKLLDQNLTIESVKSDTRKEKSITDDTLKVSNLTPESITDDTSKVSRMTLPINNIYNTTLNTKLNNPHIEKNEFLEFQKLLKSAWNEYLIKKNFKQLDEFDLENQSLHAIRLGYSLQDLFLVLEFSKLKGAKNIIWDLDKAKSTSQIPIKNTGKESVVDHNIRVMNQLNAEINGVK